jgi:hypothetical protein
VLFQRDCLTPGRTVPCRLSVQEFDETLNWRGFRIELPRTSSIRDVRVGKFRISGANFASRIRWDSAQPGLIQRFQPPNSGSSALDHLVQATMDSPHGQKGTVMTKADTNRGRSQEVFVPRNASEERRRERRFSLELSCRVCLASTERVEFAGTVINISRSGVLVGVDSAQISGLLRPDGAVRVVIDLPRHPSFSPRCLECIATVVRIVAAKAQTQVAFEVGQMQVKVQNTEVFSTPDWLSAPIEGLIQ